MKFCKDCKHFEPEFSCDGGSLLPGFFYYREPLCKHPDGAKEVIDRIKGDHRWLNMGCKFNRDSEDARGPRAKWFEPANLDGRLAMLEND